MNQPFYFMDVTNQDLDILANIGKVLSTKSEGLSHLAYDFYQKQESIRRFDIHRTPFIEVTEYFILLLSEELQTNFSQVQRIEWVKKLNKKCLDIQMPIDCLIFIAPFVKQTIWHFITSQMQREKITGRESMVAVQVIDFFIARMQEETGTSVVQKEKENVYLQTLKELKAPVIPVTRGIGVLPLVGDVDSYKSQLIMDSAVGNKVKDLQLGRLILDLSGVNHMDTSVAQDIFNFSASMSLLGIEIIIVGVNPDIAQTSVNLNISFNDFKVYPNLSIALEDLMEKEK